MPTSNSKEPFELWRNPPSDFRGAPFWSWNSRLDPDRLCRTIESMHQAGMGGFFMHSRYGLKTPYLGEDWFGCVSACIQKAQQLGMKAYLYDEDRWPSGAAGGLVTREQPEFRMRRLTATAWGEPHPGAEHVASFEIQRDAEGRLTGYQAVENSSASCGNAVSFDVVETEAGGWHNDGTYLDTMNPKAVAEFVRVTHQAYADRYQKHFGGTVPAIFTDEPNYGYCNASFQEGSVRKYYLQWTSALPQEFKKRWGYDLRDHLPETCLAGAEPFSKVRYHYRRTVTELFTDAFARQIGQWCDRHHIALTGHWLGEESLASQCHVIGAAMPQYEHEQWPGIDILRDSADELLTAKQCASVADQLARPRVLSELYGCTGWDWPLEGHKFVGDWQYAVGVNFRCPHLTHYSLAGGAKRDYPASIFSHSPWWRYYSHVEDYFARLSYMLTQGQPVRDVLVIHPIESAWGMFAPLKRGQAQPLEAILQKPLNRLTRALSNLHFDWDFGDESLLAKHAKVSGASFQVGQMPYQTVIVPPTVTLRSSTLALLNKFAQGGGRVLFVGRLADRVDAEPSPAVAELAAQCATSGDNAEEILAAVGKLQPRRLSLSENGKELDCLWAMLRTVKASPRARASQLLFVQSHDRRGAHAVQVEAAGHGPVVLWDALTGARAPLDSREEGGRVRFQLSLPATGTALVSLGLKVKAAARRERGAREKASASTDPRGGATAAAAAPGMRSFAGPFEIELTEPNTLNLDTCRYRIGEEPFSQPVPSLKADEEIRKRFGLGRRLGGEHQPWYLYAKGTVDLAPRGNCQVRRAFHVTDVPRSCRLAIEMPDRFQITVNGQSVSKVDGWWVDEDIKTIDVATQLKPGENEVLLSFNYQPDMELEDVYLVGDFGVNQGRYKAPAAGTKDTNVRRATGRTPGEPISLVAPPKTLSLGSWVGQGLDFYGGAVKYKLHAHGLLPVSASPGGPDPRVILKLPGIACTAAAIHLNGKTFVLPWGPFEADITEALRPGDNDLLIEVIGGRKNILGPLHVPWEGWTGPVQFDPNNEKWTSDYLLADHGLTAPVVLETIA